MTSDQLRAYLGDPAKDANPAILAARLLVDERDRLKSESGWLLRELGRRSAEELCVEVLHAEIGELKAGLASYEKELARLRELVQKTAPAPWEVRPDAT